MKSVDEIIQYLEETRDEAREEQRLLRDRAKSPEITEPEVYDALDREETYHRGQEVLCERLLTWIRESE